MQDSAATLAEQQRRFRVLCDNMREVFWIEDPSFELIYASPSFERVWGRSVEELYAHKTTWMDAIHSDDVDRVRETFAKILDDGEWTAEYRIVRPDGTQRWIRDRGFPMFDDQGNVYQIAGIAEDVTDRKEDKAKLVQSERVNSLAMMAGGIAHEINNPLSAIWNSVETARRLAGVTDDDKAALQQECLETAINSVKRCSETVKTILSIARNEPIVSSPVDCEAIVKLAIANCQELIEDRRATVESKLPANLPPVLANEAQISTVLTNLIRNAIESGENVQVQIDGHEMGHYVEIDVIDNGQGMTTEQCRQALTPFVTSKDKPKGTGIGLFLAYQIAVKHQGDLRLSSEPGQGTKATVSLRIAEYSEV